MMRGEVTELYTLDLHSLLNNCGFKGLIPNSTRAVYKIFCCCRILIRLRIVLLEDHPRFMIWQLSSKNYFSQNLLPEQIICAIKESNL